MGLSKQRILPRCGQKELYLWKAQRNNVAGFGGKRTLAKNVGDLQKRKNEIK